MRSVLRPALILSVAVLLACATASPPLPLTADADPAAAQQNTAGVEQYTLGHWDQAKQHFEAALKASPKSAEAHYNMALTLDKLGDHSKARGYFKRAAELAPGNTAITQSTAYQIHVVPPKDNATSYGLGSGTAATGKFGY